MVLHKHEMKMFTSYFSTQKVLKSSISANQEGNPQKALKILEPLLHSKKIITSCSLWKSTWKIVSEIFEQLGDQQLASLSQANLFIQDHPHQFYHFGYELVERGLYVVGLPVLKRAALLFPNNEQILTEIAHILEQLKLYREGKECLLQAPKLVQTAFMPRYLVVFYSIMTGDLEEANKWFSGLDQLLIHTPLEYRESYEFMFDNIQAMLDRAKLLLPHTPLDSSDLRGWNAVVNGNIVLHLSEYAMESMGGRYAMESMGGRYAFYQESSTSLFRCISQLKDVLDNLYIQPKRILSLPDRDSCILSHQAAKFLQCPVEIFSAETNSLPGLIVCYCSDLIDSDSFDFLAEAKEDQVLWCHASNWTQDSIAPDFISYFSQCTCPPWGKQLTLDIEGLESDEKPNVIEKDPLEGTPEHVAETLYKTYETQQLEDTEQAKVLARLLFCHKNENNAFSAQRTRSRQWVDSPISSEPFSLS
ncbi:tetratricopeptide repeat protein [Simkania sp.]|uniref:tetratricopeptide repeat protein n=1 Tax=Simkania sp. TaxID=34094 RepID=UPI003B526299